MFNSIIKLRLKQILYFLLKFYIKTYSYIYFRNIKLYGLENIPRDGGVLYSPNHQGAFLDPLLVGAFTPETITSLTRADVFNGPQKWFFDVLKMLPVYRIRNGYQNLKKNDATFKQCYSLLGNKGNMLMFSEGGHHDEYYLQTLSKGSSRLAYQAQMKYPKEKIYIMPVGLNYGHHKQARCSLHFVFGTPLLVQDFITPSASEAQIINQVKEALTYKMKACLWIPEESNQYEQQKKWINAKNTLLEFSDLKEKLALGEGLLNAKKISGRNLLGHILSLPNLIPLWITRVVINRSEDRVFVSSIKYASGAFLFPIWWFCSTLTIATFFGLSIALLYFLVSLASLFLRQRILLI